MFKRRRKEKSKAAFIVLTDSEGRMLTRTPVSEYLLKEETVLALSMEFFSDPEPCAIHRGAVHRRAMMELMELISPGTSVCISSLLPSAQRYFPDGAAFVRFEEEAE
ncbi:MAG: hypothetical protein IJC48_02370 [Clostridia bacterium]|nr:hypothetical protein [Clostridia bacterium]